MNKKLDIKPKKLLAGVAKVLLILVVGAFTGLLSFNFWKWTFPPEQWYYALLGFGLTGGGVIAYLIMFLWEDETDLRTTISFSMLVISIIGEVVTAGFGIKVENWTRNNQVPLQGQIDFMTVAVQVLLLFHFAAVVIYYAGDKIAAMFADDDGDGVPNFLDRNNNRQSRPQQQPANSNHNQPMHSNAAETGFIPRPPSQKD